PKSQFTHRNLHTLKGLWITLWIDDRYLCGLPLDKKQAKIGDSRSVYNRPSCPQVQGWLYPCSLRGYPEPVRTIKDRLFRGLIGLSTQLFRPLITSILKTFLYT